VVQEGFKVCPYCAEEIRTAAVICRFCKSPQPGVDASQLPPPPAPGEPPKSHEPTEAERRLQEQVDKLKKFIPAKVMQRLTEGFSDAIEEGERRNITVMFVDLVGFTALSETLDPEATNEELTRPIEKMVASLPGLKETRSWTYAGAFWGYAGFDRGTDMRFRVIEFQDRVNQWRANVPRRVEVEVTPLATGADRGWLMDLTLSFPAGAEAGVGGAADLVRRKIRSIDGKIGRAHV